MKSTLQKYHFIGIGGIGMSGLARILINKKNEVSGSDLSGSSLTEELQKEGIQVFIGHSSNHITPEMHVVYSSMVKKDNPEYQKALELNCPLLHRSDLLLKLTDGYKTLAIAGTHGKTTTSSLLTAVLVEAKLDPSYSIGGIIKQFQSNSRHGEGPYFIAEADESDGTFLKYRVHGGIVTNIDLDHMDHFNTEEELLLSFQTFLNAITSSKHLFWCGEDKRLCSLHPPGFSYGFGPSCALRAKNIKQTDWHLTFDIEFQDKVFSNVSLNLIGVHNVLNALAVFGMALSLGINEKIIRSAFASFQGIERRCEKKGEAQNLLVLDDYAHHPTEIVTTLQGIREAIGSRRLIVLFQPHRYSRTKECLGTFGTIFDAADALIITDIYGAGESPIAELTSERIVEEIRSHSSIPVSYMPREMIIETLKANLLPHDVIVTLGAGDITQLGGQLIRLVEEKPLTPLRVGVIYGGRSVEHEVALSSASYVCSGLQQSHYQVIHFGITKEGKWIVGSDALEQLKECCKKEFSKLGEWKECGHPVISSEVIEQLLRCDLLFPIIHGTYCEDGTIQGMFEILDKPYVGCDHRAAAICMDKVLTKKLAESAGLKVTPYIAFNAQEWRMKGNELRQKIAEELIYPVYVKPVHLGSSIGVKKVERVEELEEAVRNALRLDMQIMVERAVQDCRELEFAVIGNDKITVLPPAEYCSEGQFMSYQGKYGQQAIKMNTHADLSDELREKGMRLAEKAYLAVGCSGFSRVDFFLDSKNSYWFNEINPIPGCTPTSQFPLVCQANGISSSEVINRLVILALQRKRHQNRVAFKYDGSF